MAELWYTDELEEELLEILRDKLGQVVDEIWTMRVSAFNERFQQELEKALRDYIGSGYHWLWQEDGTLTMSFGYIDAADHIPSVKRPLKEALEEFIDDRVAEGEDPRTSDDPEVQRAQRLLEAWDAGAP